MNWQSSIALYSHFFNDAEKPLLTFKGLSASLFRYSTGVAALRLVNRVGKLVMLPFQGQQIWDAEFFGRTLTMKSMFREPYPTQEYLRTYGAFLLHCGALTMGVPGKEDSHPLHGELPNAPYQSAHLLLGEDERGAYLGLTGNYQYTVAFNHNYLACPLVKLYENSSRIAISLTVKNLKRTPMDLMYLAHVNFRPVDYAELVYSAPCTPEHVRVRSAIPPHIRPQPGYAEFLNQLRAEPAMHNVLKPDLKFDPEVVFLLDYAADEQGWGHSMQIHPDGSADFISHRMAELDHGVRWISRTADQDALGINLPATAEPDGYTAAKAKGAVKTLPAGEEVTFMMEAGALTPQEARIMRAKIEKLLAGKS